MYVAAINNNPENNLVAAENLCSGNIINVLFYIWPVKIMNSFIKRTNAARPPIRVSNGNK